MMFPKTRNPSHSPTTLTTDPRSEELAARMDDTA